MEIKQLTLKRLLIIDVLISMASYVVDVVTDWNGSLTRSTEEASNKHIGYSMLDKAKDTKNYPKLLQLGILKIATKTALALKNRGLLHLRNVYRPFNLALHGVPVQDIEKYVLEFARATKELVDTDTLDVLRDLRKQRKTGILSVAYKRVIERTLTEAGYDDVFSRTDIVANDLLSKDGKALGLTLRIYEEKARVMEEEFFRKRSFRPQSTVYIGDTKDDEPVAKLLPSGHFIVPLIATDDFKQHMASKHKAFVPSSPQELVKYLISII